MGEKTDKKLRYILKEIAKVKNVKYKDLVSLFINHKFNEFLSRKDFYEEMRQILLQSPIDIEKLASTIKEKGFAVKGSISINIQIKDFFDSGNAGKLLHSLVGDGNSPPTEDKINQFINDATKIAFKDKIGKRKDANAALFASAILSSVFPKSFVDYRIGRWKWMSGVFDLEPFPDDASVGAKLLWAGRIASEFAATKCFREYFSDTEIELNWCAAALTIMLNSPKSEFNTLINDILIPKTPGGNNIMSSMPLNQILYGPPGTGKTYISVERAVEICDGSIPDDRKSVVARFKELQEKRQIEFVTFHQSYSYEEFVEGIRPFLTKDSEEDEGEYSSVQYELQDGIFKKLCTFSKNVPVKTMKQYDFDVTSVKIWKMSLGNTLDPSKSVIYEECIEEKCIRLGYGKGLDFSGCDNRQAVIDKLRTEYHDMDRMDYNITAVDTFKNKIQIGDIIVVSDGNTKFRAIGRITGKYQPPAEEENDQKRDVEWLITYDESLPFERILKGKFSQKTLYELKGNILKIDALKELISGHTQNGINNYVLIIDEINRGNISKILGELITLLEPDKRLGAENELTVKLPYSGDLFGVPSNLYIIGTMNTADRSIAFLDTALRRRFKFVEMVPDTGVLRSVIGENGVVDDIDIAKMLDILNERIEFLYDRDHQLGHSYFISTDSLESLREVFLDSIIPLLQEYFYGDWEKLCLVLGCPYNPESGGALTNNKYPIVKSKKLVTDRTPWFDRDDFEIRLRYEINSEFIEAKGNTLKQFYSAIIDAGNTNADAE